MKKWIVSILALILLLSIPAGIAQADPLGDRIIKRGESVREDITIFEDSLTIEEGAEVSGEIVIFNGVADIAGDINGDVSVFGGDLVLSGNVDGDLVLLGGSVTLAQSAVVDGDCIVLGGALDDTESSVNCVLDGVNIPGLSLITEELFSPSMPDAIGSHSTVVVRENRLGQFLFDVGTAIGQTITLGIIALVVASLFPRHLAQISAVIREKPAASGAVGGLTAIATASIVTLLSIVSGLLVIVFCIGLLGFPIVLGIALLFVGAALMGWVAVGNLLGEWLMPRLNMENASFVTTTALGTLVLTLSLGLLNALPFVFGTTVVAVILACIGIGAATLTRMGTRPYPPPALSGEPKIEAILRVLPDDDPES